MNRLIREHCTSYEFLATAPKLTVDPGETFVVETEDALGGILTSDAHLPTEATFGERLAREEFNACAGPIAIRGAEPGDVLVVEINEIEVGETGVTCIFEGVGPLADSATYLDCRGPYTKVVSHSVDPTGATEGTVHYEPGVTFPLRPHIGTIAVAPARPYSAGADGNYGQGRWGGNMDSRDVRRGNRVLLPVEVPDAMLYVGDVHGSMGDGEIYGTANETAADLTLTCTLIKQKAMPWARIETAEHLIQLCSFRPVEGAVEQAFRWMLEWLVEDHGFSPRDAYVRLCIDPDVRINVYQMATLGRLAYTVGVGFPTRALG